MMIEVCIRLVMLSLTVPKISRHSVVLNPGLDGLIEATAILLGLVPDTIEQAIHTVRFVG